MVVAASDCSEPVRIPYNPSHCGNCGGLIVEHRAEVLPTYDPSLAAMWRWFLEVGAVRDSYGVRKSDTEAIRFHLGRCAIDVNACISPVPATIDEFVDTEAGPLVVDVQRGSVSCECGTIDDALWTIPANIGFADALTQIVALARDDTR